jgi:hypothetical protein
VAGAVDDEATVLDSGRDPADEVVVPSNDAARIDTDRVIHLVCKHPDRSSDSIRRVLMTPL